MYRYFVINLATSVILLIVAAGLINFSFGGIMESINLIKIGRILTDNPGSTADRIETLRSQKNNLLLQLQNIDRRNNITIDSLLAHCRNMNITVAGISRKNNIARENDSKASHVIVLTGDIAGILNGLHVIEDSLVSDINALMLKKNLQNDNLVDLQLDLTLHVQ